MEKSDRFIFFFNLSSDECPVLYHMIVLLIMIALNITFLYFALLCHLLFYFIAVKEPLF